MTIPSPRPSTSMWNAAAPVLVVWSSDESSHIPIPATSVPAIGKTLYRPVRVMIWPETIDEISRPPITGSSCRPDAVGLSPRTTCWKSGRYVSAPKSAKPTTRPTVLQTTKTRLPNSDGGRIGSFAWRSTKTKATSATMPRTPMPTISGEPQS